MTADDIIRIINEAYDILEFVNPALVDEYMVEITAQSGADLKSAEVFLIENPEVAEEVIAKDPEIFETLEEAQAEAAEEISNAEREMKALGVPLSSPFFITFFVIISLGIVGLLLLGSTFLYKAKGRKSQGPVVDQVPGGGDPEAATSTQSPETFGGNLLGYFWRVFRPFHFFPLPLFGR